MAVYIVPITSNHYRSCLIITHFSNSVHINIAYKLIVLGIASFIAGATRKYNKQILPVQHENITSKNAIANRFLISINDD